MSPIGVVIPLYNKRNYIRRAVASVLAQTHQDFSLTIVDDGSTDGSAELVEVFHDSRIQVLHTKRLGPGGARNAGIGALDAEWIGLLDADDHWHPEFLRKTLTVALQVPYLVAVFTDVHVAGSTRRRRDDLTGRVTDYHHARMRLRIAMSSSSILLRKSSFVSIGGFNEQYLYAEDIDAWFRLACSGPTYYIHEPLAEIEIHDPSSATRALRSSERVAGLENLLESYAAYRRDNRIPPEHLRSCRRFMEHQRGRLAFHICNSGHRGAGIRLLLTSVPLGTHTWCDYVDCLRLAVKFIVPT